MRKRPIVRIASSSAGRPRASIFAGVGATREQGARRLVDAAIGRLRRQQHGGEQLEDARVLELGRGLGVGVAQGREERLDVGGASSASVRCGVAAVARQRRARASRARASAAAMVSLARRRQWPRRLGADPRRGAERARRAARSARAPARRRARVSRRPSRCASPLAPTIAMQSTGQTGTHSSQPVQSSSITVCIRLAAPTIASTGHAFRQSAQPMHARLVDERERARRFAAAVRVERQRPAGRSGAPAGRCPRRRRAGSG